MGAAEKAATQDVCRVLAALLLVAILFNALGEESSSGMAAAGPTSRRMAVITVIHAASPEVGDFLLAHVFWKTKETANP